ncbi:glycosyltransferase family 4 protein [Parabacteroides chinchillae]|uniref:Glycosyltransferase involved in cell wall bisynthesis n=1 Tax=Parabacteroides chinchillae TaxID=871327 RepID=A0A8G2F373_9BACT|nr:glycosyltransferase family 4 protein [Parabacteroides chinchillae]SEF46362.1 Glycosyltransferase involved in cell wall bisynthesis [Parabacteroides chinchillae]
MNKKNVLIITPSLNPEDNISGISSVTRLLLEYNKEINYIPFLQGKKDTENRNLGWLLKQMMTPFRLLKCLSDNSIDIVHFNIGFEPFSLFRDMIIYYLLIVKSYPVILHIHGGRFVKTKPANKLLKLIIDYLLRHANQILVLSELERKSLSDLYNVQQGCIDILSNAVMPSTISFSDKAYEAKSSILYLGRIDKNKGLLEILESLTELNTLGEDFEFNLCGVGSDRDWFVEECRKRIGDKFIDRGLVYGNEKLEILKRSQVFLLPSYFEGLPMALLESMNNLVVPVVTPVGSMPDVVKSGENGFLVTSTSDITETLLKLIKDRTLLRKLSVAAKETIDQSYSLDSYLKKMNDLYMRLKK